jgi:hypothetical protein
MPNKALQPTASGASRTFDFMKRFSLFEKLSPTRGG